MLPFCREEVRAMFRFAWSSYKRYGFPADEVKPLSCKGADPFGGYSTTIVDALDTLVVRVVASIRAR